eukprot:COSAG06_NODE_1923_length_8061_cov_15.756091_5_plen_104_part_00
MIILPSQARDKHRQKSEKRNDAFSAGCLLVRDGAVRDPDGRSALARVGAGCHRRARLPAGKKKTRTHTRARALLSRWGGRLCCWLAALLSPLKGLRYIFISTY